MYKSEAHKIKIKELYDAGKISEKDFQKFEKASVGLKLPKRLHEKKEKPKK